MYNIISLKHDFYDLKNPEITYLFPASWLKESTGYAVMVHHILTR